MIYQVAIKSLPQDWLWCETWCDDESKQRAKTIDLVSIVSLHPRVTYIYANIGYAECPNLNVLFYK